MEEVEAILARRASERLNGVVTKYSLLKLLQRWRRGGSEKEPFATHAELCGALNALGVPLAEESWRRFLVREVPLSRCHPLECPSPPPDARRPTPPQERHDPRGSGRVHLLTLADACVTEKGQGWLEGLGENGFVGIAGDVTLLEAERAIVEKVAELAHLSGYRALRQTLFSEPSKARSHTA